jgi:hypothetical protein
MIGEDVFVITKLKQVLQHSNVFSVEEHSGIVFNRRMVRDDEIRISRSVAGIKGMKSRYSDDVVCYNKKANKKITTSEYENEDENEKNKEIRIADEKRKDARNKHGEYKNVILTDEQYARLTEEWGARYLEAMIKELDEGIEMKGYKYKNHNLALRKWAARAKSERRAPVIELPDRKHSNAPVFEGEPYQTTAPEEFRQLVAKIGK